MNEELIITNEDIELLKEMKNNCLKADVYNDEKRLLKANAITKFLMLEQENQQLKKDKDEFRKLAMHRYKYASEMEEKYILEKAKKDQLRSWLEDEIKEIDRHTTTLDIFNTYDYETIHEMETKKITYKNVLSKLNELEGSKNDK